MVSESAQTSARKLLSQDADVMPAGTLNSPGLTAQEASIVPAGTVHQGELTLPRIARKVTPAAALAALGILYGDLA